MEAFLLAWAPRHLPNYIAFDITVYNGKHDLLAKLPNRLKGYRGWLPADWRLLVVVDRDDEDCMMLKQRLEDICCNGGFATRASATNWNYVTCIAIEELESWYFGEWNAVRAAFPRASQNVPRQARYRDPDAINGGTWEAFERVLQSRNYFLGGLQKVAAAREIGAHFVADRCSSPSFQHFVRAMDEATTSCTTR